MNEPPRDPERSATASALAAIVASLLEEGSLRAARARGVEDAEALRQLGEDVATLAGAMVVLLTPRP